MPETGNAQLWVSSGFKPGPDAQHMTAYCSTSAIDPATGNVSPTATDYESFYASCSVTSSTGDTFTNPSPTCSNPGAYLGWPGQPSNGTQANPWDNIADPTGICKIDFTVQQGVQYTLNSVHWMLFNQNENGASYYFCNPYNTSSTCNFWLDPEGFMILPLKFGPYFSTKETSIVQEITGSMTGTGVNQIFPFVSCSDGQNIPSCDFNGIWQIASTSAQYSVCPTPKITSISPRTWFAGKSYDVTITGTGFTSPACPVTPVVSWMNDLLPNLVVSPTQITFTITPPANAPTENAGVVIGNATNGGKITVRTQVLGNQIQWTQNGKTSTISTTNGSTPPIQNAVVGQQIVLKTTTPATTAYDGSPVSQIWTVDGTRIKNYAPTTASASVTELADADLKNNEATFYWVYPGSPIPVTYQYCVNIPGASDEGQCSLPANAVFTVTGPTASIHVNPRDWMVSDPFTACDNLRVLALGWLNANTIDCTPSVQIPGIEFEAIDISGIPDSGGEFQWVQLLTANTLKGTSPGEIVPPLNLGTGLDKSYPYPPDNPLDTPSNTKASDTLTNNLDSTLATQTRTTNATMYLLWKSKVDNSSIPVPLAYVPWAAYAKVTINGWNISQKPTTGQSNTSTKNDPNYGLPTWGIPTSVNNESVQSDEDDNQEEQQ